MAHEISLTTVEPRRIVAQTLRVQWNEIGKKSRRPLSGVWNFLASCGVTEWGPNIFLYENSDSEGADASFGVATIADIGLTQTSGKFIWKETPGGRAATTLHIGSYDELAEASREVIDWCKTNGHALTGVSWEVYADPNEDTGELRTDIYFQLA